MLTGLDLHCPCPVYQKQQQSVPSCIPTWDPCAQRRLAEEYERCQHYLDPATRKPLIAAVEAQLLERHIGAILEKGACLCQRQSRRRVHHIASERCFKALRHASLQDLVFAC